MITFPAKRNGPTPAEWRSRLTGGDKRALKPSPMREAETKDVQRYRSLTKAGDPSNIGMHMSTLFIPSRIDGHGGGIGRVRSTDT